MTDETRLALPPDYPSLLEELKERVGGAQLRAAVSVNRELVLLYWAIGQRILAAQAGRGWGSQVVRKLSADLTQAFPRVKGFSPRNLSYMRAFAEAWPDEAPVQQVVAQVPWGLAEEASLGSRRPRHSSSWQGHARSWVSP